MGEKECRVSIFHETAEYLMEHRAAHVWELFRPQEDDNPSWLLMIANEEVHTITAGYRTTISRYME
jgi:hypothetical protein